MRSPNRQCDTLSPKRLASAFRGEQLFPASPPFCRIVVGRCPSRLLDHTAFSGTAGSSSQPPHPGAAPGGVTPMRRCLIFPTSGKGNHRLSPDVAEQKRKRRRELVITKSQSPRIFTILAAPAGCAVALSETSTSMIEMVAFTFWIRLPFTWRNRSRKARVTTTFAVLALPLPVFRSRRPSTQETSLPPWRFSSLTVSARKMSSSSNQTAPLRYLPDHAAVSRLRFRHLRLAGQIRPPDGRSTKSCSRHSRGTLIPSCGICLGAHSGFCLSGGSIGSQLRSGRPYLLPARESGRKSW